MIKMPLKMITLSQEVVRELSPSVIKARYTDKAVVGSKQYETESQHISLRHIKGIQRLFDPLSETLDRVNWTSYIYIYMHVV